MGGHIANVVDEHSARTGFRVGLSHVDAGQNLTKFQLIQRGLSRGKHRLQKLNVLAQYGQALHEVGAPVFAGDGEFLLSLSIGTPPVPFSAIMDTGSDLIWTQCKPCKSCFNQTTPIFDPDRSSSFSKVPCTNELCRSKALGKSRCGVGNSCDYVNVYADESSTKGFLAMDNFNFGESVSVPNIGFGCGVSNQGIGLNQSAGLVGLGRGSMSLVSQLHTKQFSYCFSSIGTKRSGSLFVGSLADLNISKGTVIKSTPLIKNPLMPSFYYISLQGITVGKTLLPIPVSLFELGSEGSGGFVLDSGTTFTMLQEDAFDTLSRVFATQTKLPVSNSESPAGFSLCFELPASKANATGINFPRLVFHFKGGLDLELPTENYIVTDAALGLACLAMGPTGSLSIFGNVQQQNILVLHDLEKETLSFVPAKCDQL